MVSADGVDVQPVTVDELQIGNAETYDIVVTPEDRAYTMVVEGTDPVRNGDATLAPRAGMRAAVPPLRERPVLTMKDMGMGDMAMGGMDHSSHGVAADAAPIDHDMRDKSKVTFKVGPGVDMIAPMRSTGSATPAWSRQGRAPVLTYRDLVAMAPGKDRRTPTRRIDIT